MRPKILVFLLALVFLHPLFALSGNAYMERFQHYQNWSENLPEPPDEAFYSFISDDTPLAVKLRNKWLYQLASKKDWREFDKWYRPGDDVFLRCFAARAKLETGQTQEALSLAKTLWRQGNSLPQACDKLFDILFSKKMMDNELVSERIVLALEARNLPLARYLLTRMNPPRIDDTKRLHAIYQNPASILNLPRGPLYSSFYLYGLTRLVSLNMDKATTLWNNPKTRTMLSENQQQQFLAHLTLYKAMRGHADTARWFSRIKSAWYNDTLLGWQIRHALKHHQWQAVLNGIDKLQDKDNPCWRYWRARALEALGKKEDAKTLYTALSSERNYYGFLASRHVKSPPQFQNEPVVTDLKRLKPYASVTNTIQSLYLNQKPVEAARLLNEFSSELPKRDRSALAWWLTDTLQWHARAVYLSSSTDMLNNQLAVRFPLAWKDSVNRYAQKYRIPPELVYAVIRQESAFHHEIVSSAGAMGLMQILPQTGKVVARREHISFEGKNPLFSPTKNINIGVAYLEELSRRFGRHPVLMAAAYNAGPRQVRYWLSNHPSNPMDIWIETLPWQETRNYLKNIIAFCAVYQYRLDKKPDLQPFLKPVSS